MYGRSLERRRLRDELAANHMLIESNVTSFFGVVFGGPYEELGVRRRVWTAGRATPIVAATAPLSTRVRIDGTVEAIDDAVRAPFSSEPCVYWHVRLIARFVMQGMNLGINSLSPEVWNPALVLSSSNSFWVVQDDGARVLVDLDGRDPSVERPPAKEDDEDTADDDEPLEPDTREDNLIAVAPLEDVSDHPCVNEDDDRLNPFLRRHGIVPVEEMGRSGQHRFLEARIAPGQRVTVWAHLAELSSRTAVGYRDAATTVRRLKGTPTDPLVLISHPRQ